MNPYIKSIVWLVSCGGIGYVLLELTKPNGKKLQAIRESAGVPFLTEQQRQKQLFMQKLQQSTLAQKIPIDNSKSKDEK